MKPYNLLHKSLIKERSSLFAIIIGLCFAFILYLIFDIIPLKYPIKGIEADPKGIFGINKQSQGEVTVSLTPMRFDAGKLTVKIEIDTHEVDNLIEYDLVAITELKTRSRVFNPVKAPRIGSHHNSGELVFETFDLPDNFSIVISGLHSSNKREFYWP